MTGIELRYALPSDRPAMIELTKDVWGGHDYVPFVWDRWVESDPNALLAACVEGRVVGLQHMVVQEDGGCWLEGIRVASSQRGRGIAGELLQWGLEWARLHGCRVARLSTSSTNEVTQRLVTGAGFRLIDSLVQFRASADSAPRQSPVRVAMPGDRDVILDLIRSTGVRFWQQGWTSHPFTARALDTLLATNALAVTGPEGAEAVGVATCTEPFTQLNVGLLIGDPDGMAAIGGWWRRKAAVSGLTEVLAAVREGDGAEGSMKSAGFEKDDGFRLLIHELDLS